MLHDGKAPKVAVMTPVVWTRRKRMVSAMMDESTSDMIENCNLPHTIPVTIVLG